METIKSVFKAIGRFLWKIKWLFILILLGAVAFIIFKNRAQEQARQAMEEQEANKQTAVIEKRDLVSSITATGTVESNDKRVISSAIKDTKVLDILCEVGDYVSQGDILVTFTTDSIEKSINQVREDISENEAKQSIDSAANERNYYYSYGTESITLRDLQTKIDSAQKDLDEACDGYGDLKRERQEYIDDDHSEEEADEVYKDRIATVFQKVESCQLALEDAKQALQDEIYKGSHTIATQTDTYNTSNLTEGDSTKSLRRQLDGYMDELDDYQVTSPLSGVVTEISVQEGNSFTGGNIITVQDCDVLYIVTEIDEYDIPDIKVGQKVMIKTDATRDDELEGIVDTVSPTATTTNSTTTGSSVTYKVKIRILTPDERIRLGMSAKLSIVTEEKKGVLTVPYDAIVENEEGENVIYVLEEEKPQIRVAIEPEKKWYEKLADAVRNSFGSAPAEAQLPEEQQKEIRVSTGLETDYYTEISGEGIGEGQTVLIPETEEEFSMDFMFGPGGF